MLQWLRYLRGGARDGSILKAVLLIVVSQKEAGCAVRGLADVKQNHAVCALESSLCTAYRTR